VEASFNTVPPPGGASEHDTPQARGGPTVLRIILGAQLRRLRETAGITRETAAGVIRGSASKISRLELGRVGSKKRDVADLLSLYGVADERRRDSLLSLADEANTPGWWQRYGDLLPEWFEIYIGLEEVASRIRAYEVQFVPGLMQTRDYARAVVRLGHPTASDEELEQRVELRMKRQRLLTVDDPLTVWAVVDETALRRPIGGVEVMKAQLRHLLELTALPNVTLQMVPFHLGGHAAAGGPFTILRFAEPELADVVYLEQLTSALYLDKRRDVDDYSAVMDRLCVQATSSVGTVEAMEAMLRELE
jgi:transcriptional regulator with XRE-family HTH domain